MEPMIQHMIQEYDVIQAVNNVFMKMDRFDWNGFLEGFADEVEDDYTSLFQGGTHTVKHADILERWSYLKNFTALYHALTNQKVVIDGEEADYSSYVYSLHCLPNDAGGEDIWKAIGFYDYHLTKTNNGWKIDKMKFTAVSITGTQVLKRLGIYDKLQEKWKH